MAIDSQPSNVAFGAAAEAAGLEARRPGLRPALSLFDSVTIVSGSMIGSGIFIVSADIARRVGSPAGLLMVWLVSGLMTVAGALAYGELAAMMPQAGGQYVYLRRAYGELVAFLFGWTLLLVIQTGTIAAVAVAFARFLGVLWPGFGSAAWLTGTPLALSGERIGAIAVIALLTIANLRGLSLGRLVQDVFTSAKIISLLFIIVLGCVVAPSSAAIHANFGSLRAFLGERPFSLELLAAFGAAMVGGLFSADAWATVTFVAPEVKNPRRDVPLALAGGTGLVIVLYILTNFAYLTELPVLGNPEAGTTFLRGISGAPSDRVAASAMTVVWGGAGAVLTAVLVMISTFGCANGLILTGARVIYAMARDGLFFAGAARLNRAHVPGQALIMQACWASILTLSGTYSDLLDYVIFAQLVFYSITVGAVFLLRRRLPQADRPYRAWGFPYFPIAYIVAAVVLMADLLIVKPAFTWPGLIIVLTGVPVYALWVRRRRAAS
jgi:basic amino acid/polyamine antiporter, APA family